MQLIYFRLVYCAIGCCDVKDSHSDVADKIDDFLWLRLTQIQSSCETPDDEPESLRLPALQSLLLEEFGQLPSLKSSTLITGCSYAGFNL